MDTTTDTIAIPEQASRFTSAARHNAAFHRGDGAICPEFENRVAHDVSSNTHRNTHRAMSFALPRIHITPRYAEP
jgi:hypothetical protein